MTFKIKKGLGTISIVLIIIVIIILIIWVIYWVQNDIDSVASKLSDDLLNKKNEYEVAKLIAEISKIRSDTTGSLFWLKLIALFVTVGGAVGGYLFGQSRTTLAKINFEARKNVDEVYQTIVQELADQSAILKAAAAVKLGAILESFPSEWNIKKTRRGQLIRLTKQILSAALAIEENQKVLKTITISLVMNKSSSENGLKNVRELDLSGANANDAYWAKCDFKYTDFYKANLSRVSFRKSNISYAQFRESNLRDSVLAETICNNTNFKMADLRGTFFDGSSLDRVNFENAKVNSVSLIGATFKNIPDCKVDVSVDGDGSELISVSNWLKSTKA